MTNDAWRLCCAGIYFKDFMADFAGVLSFLEPVLLEPAKLRIAQRKVHQKRPLTSIKNSIIIVL